MIQDLQGLFLKKNSKRALKLYIERPIKVQA